MDLSVLGWGEFFARALPSVSAAGLEPARVALEHKHAYELLTADGEVAAVCTGRLRHTAGGRGDLPAVGDWVALRRRPGETQGDIHAVLPRRTCFSRRAPGEGGLEQVIAANVDTVLLVTALDQNFSLRRIERYLAAARASGAEPVVVLNKADLHADPAIARAEVTAIAGGAPVVVVSAVAEDVRATLARWLTPGRTLALLGSSGVGKSTMINRLLGTERQLTRAVSAAVGKGRHTTSHRELLLAPSGVLVIDTPGLRELQFWEVGAAAIDTTFADVGELAAGCRFRDCTHRAEPGCAVQAALAAGILDPGRWESFRKLQREQAYAARQADARLERENKAAWKQIHRAQRAVQREKYRDA